MNEEELTAKINACESRINFTYDNMRLKVRAMGNNTLDAARASKADLMQELSNKKAGSIFVGVCIAFFGIAFFAVSVGMGLIILIGGFWLKSKISESSTASGDKESQAATNMINLVESKKRDLDATLERHKTI